MQDRYAVRFDGPDTAITTDPDGPWSRWQTARAAAIEHLEDHVLECEKTLMCIRQSGSFFEYQMLLGEMAGSEAGGLVKVQGGDTLI